MARGANGVTCRECGCLNFSLEHEVCDKCRSKTSTSLTFRPTARRSSISHSGVSTSNNRHNEDSVHSNGKKRRYEETQNTSNKKHEKRALAPPSKKQPDVIDLISDDDEEDVVVQKVLRESLKPREEKQEKGGVFQSRVFPKVTFQANDFPTMEQGTLMRKKAAEDGLAPSQLTGPVKVGQTAASQTIPVQEKTVDSRPAEPRPPSSVEKQKEMDVQDEKEAASTGADLKDDSEEQDPLFQSRMFDAMEFRVSDFATVFDGLAVARRSHPPGSKSSTASQSCNGVISSVGPAAVSNEVTGPGKPAAGSTTTTTLSNTAKTIPKAKAEVPVGPTVPKVATTPTPATMTKHLTTPTSTKVPQQASKPSTATTAATTVQSTPAKLKSAALALAQPTKISTPAVVAPPTKAASASSHTNSSSAVTANPAVSSKSNPVSTSAPKPARVPPALTVKPSSTAKTAAKSATVVSASSLTTGSVAPQPSSAPTTSSNQTQVNDSANVLLPKKREREGIQHTDEEQRLTKSSHNAANTSSGADGVEFVKVNAAPHEVLIVEPPILGYCSPDFLAFMRECGSDDGEEEDDPEEASRSQLKLLHVVDLTNLSDSEESDAESPLSTPRDGSKQQSLSTSGQTVSQSTTTANVTVSGKGTWYVPTLDSERKRTQPEKVMCELCEEKGVPFRLIRCPTCTKYYHKKCAKENGDENICWNCELGSMIDDTELDEEHAKHDSEYLAYLKAIRRSSSPDDGEGDKDIDEYSENEDQEGEEGAGEEDVEMASPAEGRDDNKAFTEGGNTHSKRWKEFIGEATADIDADYHEVTKRIAEELRDEEKRRAYSRGFVSREEFEAQMTEVEEYYISEEARLQQLEREKALEAKKAAEASKSQVAAGQAANGEQPAGSSASENKTASVPTLAGQSGANAVAVAVSEVPSSSTTTTTTPATANAPPTMANIPPEEANIAPAKTNIPPAKASIPPVSAPNIPPASAPNIPLGSAPNAPETSTTVLMEKPAPVQSTVPQPAGSTVVPTTVPGFLSAQKAAFAAVLALKAAFSKPPLPPSKP